MRVTPPLTAAGRGGQTSLCISTTNLLVVAAWGIAALLIAARTFQFSPKSA